MRALLDVNVLVALLDPQHAAHEAAYRWLATNLVDGWATCPLTENGCLRLLTNPRYTRPMTPGLVLSKLDEAMHTGHHEFWPDDLSITSARFYRDHLRGHQQVTDMYLLGLTVNRGGRLVTFDQRIRRELVAGCGPEHLVVL